MPSEAMSLSPDWSPLSTELLDKISHLEAELKDHRKDTKSRSNWSAFFALIGGLLFYYDYRFWACFAAFMFLASTLNAMVSEQKAAIAAAKIEGLQSSMTIAKNLESLWRQVYK